MENKEYLYHLLQVNKANINFIKDALEDYYTEERVEIKLCVKLVDIKRSLHYDLSVITIESLLYYIDVDCFYRISLNNEERDFIKKAINNEFNDITTVCDLICKLQNDNFSLVLLSFLNLSAIYEVVIYFPEETITNENDESDQLLDLFINFFITPYGTLIEGFNMKRSTFLYTQYRNNYIHSHCPSLHTDMISYWSTPCLGNGPINTTINSISSEQQSPMWDIFCRELHQYIQVESIEGGPYKLLRDNNTTISNYTLIGDGFKITNRIVSNIESYILDKMIESLSTESRFSYNTTRNGSVLFFSTSYDKCCTIVLEHYIKIYNEIIEQFLTYGNLPVMDSYPFIETITFNQFINMNEIVIVKEGLRVKRDRHSNSENDLIAQMNRTINMWNNHPKSVIKFKNKEYYFKVIDNISNRDDNEENSISYPCFSKPREFINVVLTDLLLIKYENNKDNNTIKRIKRYI